MWNVKRILDQFGPDYRAGVRRALAARGLPQPDVKSVSQWRRRGRIHSDWLARLFICLPEQDPRAFLIDPTRIME